MDILQDVESEIDPDSEQTVSYCTEYIILFDAYTYCTDVNRATAPAWRQLARVIVLSQIVIKFQHLQLVSVLQMSSLIPCPVSVVSAPRLTTTI